jgi:uncharacterized protein YigE (DUF2233 family)
MLRRTLISVAGLAVPLRRVLGAAAEASAVVLKERTHRGRRWTCVALDLKDHGLALLQTGGNGQPLRSFRALEEHVRAQGRRLVLGMNAGMFEADGSPVGWCVSEGRTVQKANFRDGEGNFFLKPNGVFAVEEGRASVLETGRAAARLKRPQLVTQSGPLLVAEGHLHPGFNEKSLNLHIRNAVGVTPEGQVWLAISEVAVSFHESATLFRDDLGCPDALFLDGVVSQLHAPALRRRGGPALLGPLLAVTEPA